VSIANKATSHRLYYRKLSASSPKGYLPATDVYSSCDGLRGKRFAKANLICEHSEQSNIT
ncbi:MAG: hypothetical protein IJA69_05365, partial [Clostridia bacterium]|nr:hypothetical protein [Clostridia bacterium]